MNQTVLALLTSFMLPSFAAAQSLGAEVQRLFPLGQVTVEVLQPSSPPRLASLTQQLQAAVQADPDWFREYALSAEGGQPLPYHPKLGLTEAEYREFLQLSDSVVMKPAGTVAIDVESVPFGWRFGEVSSLPALQGLEIDTVTNEVRSSFGTLAGASPITPSEEQRAPGPWEGPRWELEALDLDSETGTVATFAIGIHSATGRTVIYFDAKRVKDGHIVERESFFLLALK
jgi:hypothetical protein